MFEHTDIDEAPWWTIKSDDKRAARINTISHLLAQVPWKQTSPEEIEFPERPASDDYVRPPKSSQRFVPDHAASVGTR